MPVTYIGSSTNTGASITFPAHQAGDLIIVMGINNLSSYPSPPLNSGYTVINSAGLGSNINATYAYIKATSSGTVSGTWKNTSKLVAIVYRQASIGGSNYATGNSSFVGYGGVALYQTDGSSWVTTLSATSNGAATLTNVPSGYFNRNSLNVGGSGTALAVADTNSGVTSSPYTSVNVGTTSYWVAFSVEILYSVDVSVSLSGVTGTTYLGDVSATAGATIIATEQVANAFLGFVDVFTGTGTLIYPNGLVTSAIISNVSIDSNNSILVDSIVAEGIIGNVDQAIFVSGVTGTMPLPLAGASIWNIIITSGNG